MPDMKLRTAAELPLGPEDEQARGQSDPATKVAQDDGWRRKADDLEFTGARFGTQKE